jgi:hypothetical protein
MRPFAILKWSGRSPNDTFHVEVVGELVAKFQKLEERRSQLERPVVRIYDLLLGPPPGRARLTDCLDEVAEQLGVELAARQEADAGLWLMELLEGWINAATANGIC